VGAFDEFVIAGRRYLPVFAPFSASPALFAAWRKGLPWAAPGAIIGSKKKGGAA